MHRLHETLSSTETILSSCESTDNNRITVTLISPPEDSFLLQQNGGDPSVDKERGAIGSCSNSTREDLITNLKTRYDSDEVLTNNKILSNEDTSCAVEDSIIIDRSSSCSLTGLYPSQQSHEPIASKVNNTITSFQYTSENLIDSLLYEHTDQQSTKSRRLNTSLTSQEAEKAVTTLVRNRFISGDINMEDMKEIKSEAIKKVRFDVIRQLVELV